MTNNNNALFCLVFIYSLFLPIHSQAALTQDPSLNWRTLYTEHFAIHFHDDEEALAKEVGDIAERVHTRLSTTYNWAPEARTEVILSDRFDSPNGSAFPLPRNEMRLRVTPPDGASVMGDYDDWLEMLIIHEYTHILHLDKAHGFPKGLRNVFGRLLFLFPNMLQPAWFIEGLATYEETDKDRGIGRGQNTFFRMLMRLEVENGIKPIHQANQPLVSWPMNTVHYLYGVYFYQFIAERYGEEKIAELVEEYSNNILPFAINNNSNRVLGKHLSPLWDEFSAYLQTEFSAEIENIRQQSETLDGETQNNKTKATQLTHTGYFTGTPQVATNGDVYYLQKDMQSEPRLMALRHKTQTPHVIADTHGSYFDLHPEVGIVITEQDAVRNTNIFSDIYHIDPNTGTKTQLTKGGRYLYATWSPDGQQIIAVHNHLGQHSLHLLDAKGKKLDTLWQSKNKTVLGPLDWSPDGKQLVMPVWRQGSLWNLELFTIADRRWQQLTHGHDIETTPRFSADGQAIVFSADYDGVFNIRHLDLSSNNIATLTNVLGGAFYPTLSQDGSTLYYIGTGVNGNDLYTIKTTFNIKTAITKTSNKTQLSTPTPQATNNQDNKKQRIEDYNALTRITPTAWFPYYRADDSHNEVGFITWGSDPLKRHIYNLLAAYDTDGEWFVGRLDYLYDRWNPSFKLSLERQVLTILDAANNVGGYRNADQFTAEALWPFFSYDRQWTLHAGIVAESESDKVASINFGGLPTLRDELLGLAVSYNSTRRYPRSISPSYGRQLRFVAEDSGTLDSSFSGQVYTLDWREFIDLPGQHVFATRLVAGWGTDSPNPFRLGGSTDTSLPANPVSTALAPTQRTFGHRRYPLRGYDKGRIDLTGRRMALIEAEWRFPIALIERGFMAPPIGLHQIHGKIFYNLGEAWYQDTPDLRRGAGLELTAELVLGYWLPVDLRLGFAKGFDLGGEQQTYIELNAAF